MMCVGTKEKRRGNMITKDSYIREKMDILEQFSIKPSPSVYDKLNSFDTIRGIDLCTLRMIRTKLDD